MNASSRSALLEHLVQDEGCVLHVYADSLGYATIGVGRLIDKRRGGGITYQEAMFLLSNDVDRFEKGVLDRFPWVAMLDDVRQVAVLNLAFNLGLDGLAEFRNTLKALQRGEWNDAARGLRQSLWFRQVQPSRSHRILSMILTGEIPT